MQGLTPGSIAQGDCLDVLSATAEGSAQLVYLDPPFNSGRDWSEASGAFTDTWESSDAYLEFMRARLEACARVLAPDGSLYLHVDDAECHRLRVMLDEIFGRAAFRAQIAWKRSDSQNAATRNYGRVLDVILYYARPGAPFERQFTPYAEDYIKAIYRHNDGDGRGPYKRSDVASPVPNPNTRFEWRGWPPPAKGWSMTRETLQRLHDEGRIRYPMYSDGSPDYTKRPQRKQYLSEMKGKPVCNLWDDLTSIRAWNAERSDYPTQKPVALLERIVETSSRPGDLVIDPFCGSGTTLVAARRLGREWAGCDQSADAVQLAKARLAEGLL